MGTPVDWRTRLAVSYVDPDGNKVDVTPIDSFSPSFTLGAEPLHSIEQTHIGAVFSPKSISFSMTVKAIGDVSAKLTALAFQGKRFDITLQEHNGQDWSFKTIVLSECIITSASPSTATTSGAPAATFSGFSMHAASADKGGGSVEIP
jgi:hypothetical protein